MELTMGHEVEHRVKPLLPGWFGLPLGLVVGIAATVSSLELGAADQPILSLIAMVAVVNAAAMLTTAPAALVTMIACWCLHADFVLHPSGELTFSSQSAHDAIVLSLVTLCALGFAALVKPARTERDAALRRIPSPRRG
jgi:K+-sensing histidine kinase KdpD